MSVICSCAPIESQCNKRADTDSRSKAKSDQMQVIIIRCCVSERNPLTSRTQVTEESEFESIQLKSFFIQVVETRLPSTGVRAG